MNRILLFTLIIIGNSAFAQVKLARLFSDHVVLQRQKPIPVWGWAKPGEKVKVTLAAQTQEAKSDASGKWIVRFTPLEAGGPHSMTVTAKSGNAVVNDILIGEVWLCSGQSNMEFPVAQAMNFQEEKKNADFPKIRHFRVDHKVTLAPEKDLESGEWKVASAETIGGFTAVGFFFAREVHEKLNVPIGLLHSSWGGSQIEGWISKEGMMTNEDLKISAQKLPKTWGEADSIMDTKLRKELFKNASFTPSLDDEQKYLSGNTDFSVWQSSNDPVGQWDWKGLMGYRGIGFMARKIEIPEDMVVRSTTLSLAENDSKNDIYINGKLISSETLNGVRKINIPANTWKAGINQLVIKMGNHVSNAWFGPGMMGKASDMFLTDGTQRIDLINDWKLMPAFAEKHTYAHLMNNVGTSIYNAMIVPLIPFAIRGTLWYQGESNASRAFQYRQSFPLMINDWRRIWNDQFSFYWVQLSTFGAENDSNSGSSWAELREAQDMTLSLPKTGMAVTTDVGNPKDIHPNNKQDVGHRLAVNALKLDYGQNIVYSSPMFEHVNFENEKAIVSFKHAESGLMVKDKYGYLKGFEIAGEDGKFYFAKADIVNNQVIVSSPAVTRPAAVRYAWSDSPVDANLYNKEGLPASGFRTDNWPGKTINSKFQ